MFSLTQTQRYKLTDSCGDVYNLTKDDLETIRATENRTQEASAIYETEDEGKVEILVSPHLHGSGTLWIERESGSEKLVMMINPDDQELMYQAVNQLLGEK